MNNDFFNQILEQFQRKADGLDSKYKESSSYTNSDSGIIREDVLVDFLNQHKPIRTGIYPGGFLFDSNGNKSNQIDLIITNDSTLQFRVSVNQNSKMHTCVEGCLCAISVKTNLIKNELFEAIDNLASIPTDKKYSYVNEFTNTKELLSKVPLKIIFAYKGESLEKCIKDIKEHFSTKNLPNEQKPDLIIVNNDYILEKMSEGQKILRSNKTMKEGSYIGYSKNETDFVGGRSLLTLLVKIQTYGNVFTEADIDFNGYLNKIKLADTTWKGS